MRNKNILAAAAVTALTLLQFSPSSAAVLTVSSVATDAGPPPNDGKFCQQSASASALNCSINASSLTSTADGFARADAMAGELGVLVTASGQDFTIEAASEIVEGFTVTSAGTFTFSVLFEGVWDIFDDPSPFAVENFSAFTTLIVNSGSPTGPVLGVTGYGLTGQHQGAIAQPASMSLALTPGYYVLEAALLASIGAGTTGRLDFLHTAAIFVETLDGAFQFDTAGFLSTSRFNSGGPGGPSEVPLPASLPLMLLGVGALSAAVKRRKAAEERSSSGAASRNTILSHK